MRVSRSHIPVLALVGLVLLCLAPPVAASDWSQYQRDARNTGAGEVAEAVGAWSHRLDGQASSPATPFGEPILVGDGSGVLHALAPADGEELWRRSFESALIAAPVTADDSLYVVEGRGVLHAMGRNGTERWRFRLANVTGSTPAVSDDTVYAASVERLVAVKRATGAARWNRSLADVLLASPTLAGDTVFVGTTETPSSVGEDTDVDGWLTAYAADDGERRWRVSTPGVIGVPAVAGEVVVVATTEGVVALDRRDGSRRWNASLDATGLSTPVVANGTVVVGSQGGALHGLDVGSGHTSWTVTADDAFTIAPAVSDGDVYAAGRGGSLHVIDLGSGRQRWRAELGGTVVPTAVTALDGAAVVGVGDRVLTLRNGSSPGRIEDGGRRPTTPEGDAVAGGEDLGASDDDGEVTSDPQTDGASETSRDSGLRDAPRPSAGEDGGNDASRSPSILVPFAAAVGIAIALTAVYLGRLE